MNEIYRVLDRNSPMRGQFFLEASAGTGKTFTIEHMVVRLLITEPVMSLDQILVVTFTKAATRELRQRIYAKIQESLRMWKEESLDAPDYLQALFGDETTFLRLERAKALIEEAPIYTIHSFCMKMLSSNAFEAKVSLSPLEEEEDIENLLDVFRSLEPYKEFSPNEIFALLQKHQRDIYSICRSLKGVKKIEGANFEQRWLQEGSNLSKEEFDEQMKKNSDETLSKLASYAAKHVRLSPDEFLAIMQSSLKNPNFVQKVRNRFQAAIIDEFQDTDPLQWEIFFKLFVENPLPFLCFVGDPKQSIYAFRNADIHTFVHARNFFSPYVLSTNYRSHPTLLEALNFLFDNESKWLGDKIAYIPVSGKEGYEKPLIEDGKGAVHILHAKCEKKSSRKWPSESVELEILFPNIANEILSLNLPFSSIAILVKDRFQGKRLSSYLQTLNIACITKNSGLITDTKAFILFYNYIKKHETINWQILEEWILTCDLEDYEDLMHLSELALEQGSSSHTLLKWMDSIKAKSSDSDPNVKKRTLKDGECVQIMTVHASKGLEFDVVFSLGLASRQKEEEPSLDKDEEKMRLLYVAFTRAKRRLYIPYLEIIDEKKRPVDSLSAIEMFFDKVFFQKNWQEKILSSQKSISIEEITKNSSTALKTFELCDLIQPPLIQIERPSVSLLSFSNTHKKTASRTLEGAIFEKKEEILPLLSNTKGAKIGTFFHKLLEKLLFSGNYEDKDLLEKEIKKSPFALWQDEIIALIDRVLVLDIDGFCLKDVNPACMIQEMEFLLKEEDAEWKGFADLVFFHNNHYYLIDWKMHLLENYEEETLKKVIKEFRYEEQASLYLKALSHCIDKTLFKGAYYVFVRGPRCIKLDI